MNEELIVLHPGRIVKHYTRSVNGWKSDFFDFSRRIFCTPPMGGMNKCAYGEKGSWFNSNTIEISPLVPIYESGFVKPGGAENGKQWVLHISLAVGVGRSGPVRPTFRGERLRRLLHIS